MTSDLIALGSLGGVDHFANIPRSLGVAMVGRQYRIVWTTVINGAGFDEPFDDRIFDSVYVARAEVNAIKAARATLPETSNG